MKKILSIAILSCMALSMGGCKNHGHSSSSSSDEPASFNTRFNASPNSEPASVSPGDAGQVQPDAEPHNL